MLLPKRLRKTLLLTVLVTVCLFPRPSFVCGFAAKSGKKKRSVGGGFGKTSSSGTVAPIGLTPDTSKTTSSLLTFLKSQKATIGNVAVGIHPEHGRGLYTTKNFDKREGGQILCRVPSDCVLALSDPSQPESAPKTAAAAGWNLLHMYIENKQRRAQFAPYLDSLPTTTGNSETPDFWTRDEINMLEFPRLVQSAQSRKEEVLALAEEMSIIDKHLQWATWVVSSRSRSLSVSSGTTSLTEFDDRGQVLQASDDQKHFVRVLIPLLDLVNHSSDQPNARLTLIDPQKDEAWFALETLRPIPAGTEIRIPYGSGTESSVELLGDYGFVPPTNKVDSFMIKKGGDDCFSKESDWTTTLADDRATLQALQTERESTGGARETTMEKVLRLRIRLKEAATEG